MTDSIGVSLSGLLDAATRVNVSANNVANARSTQQQLPDGEVVNEPFIPQTVSSISQETGGVQSVVQNVPEEVASIEVQEPQNLLADENGLVSLPNVDQATETVNLISAQRQFEANLATLQAADETQDSLLDILE